MNIDLLHRLREAGDELAQEKAARHKAEAALAERDKLLRRVLKELDESPRDGISDELRAAIRATAPAQSPER
jgi:hypothetical protein